MQEIDATAADLEARHSLDRSPIKGARSSWHAPSAQEKEQTRQSVSKTRPKHVSPQRSQTANEPHFWCEARFPTAKQGNKALDCEVATPSVQIMVSCTGKAAWLAHKPRSGGRRSKHRRCEAEGRQKQKLRPLPHHMILAAQSNRSISCRIRGSIDMWETLRLAATDRLQTQLSRPATIGVHWAARDRYQHDIPRVSNNLFTVQLRAGSTITSQAWTWGREC